MEKKNSQKFFDHTKQFATYALKTASKRAIQKPAGDTDFFIGNKIADKIHKSQKLHKKLIQKLLHMSMIKNYLNKKYIPRRKTESC